MMWNNDRDLWKDAMLEALSSTGMDASPTEAPCETLERLIKWHVSADARCLYNLVGHALIDSREASVQFRLKDICERLELKFFK